MAQDPVGNAKVELFRDLDATFARMMALVPPSNDLKPRPSENDEWGLFEVLSHIDGWHRSAAMRLHQIATRTEVLHPSNTDALNDRFVRERRGLAGPALMLRLLAGYGEMREAGREVPDEDYWRGREGAEDSLAYFILNENGPAHYREHFEELSRAP